MAAAGGVMYVVNVVASTFWGKKTADALIVGSIDEAAATPR